LGTYRTILNAAPASCTKIHVDAACTFLDPDLEIPGRAFDRFKISIGDKFDIQVPADLDQFRRDNSHGAIICGEGFVQL